MQASLFPFQKKAANRLLAGAHIIIANTGVGKTAIMFNWLARTKARKVLVVSTPAKIKSHDMETEADKFNGPEWRQSLDEYHTVSWYTLKKWADNRTTKSLKGFAIAYDELAHASAGISSLQGKAFLMLTKHCQCWAGFTATPGDTWLKFYPYFQASGLIKNKTAFMREFCVMNPYTPFPKVEKYKNTKQLREWWAQISYSPDASEVLKQLPPETHKRVKFPPPKGYKQVLKTCHTLEGELLESDMAVLHYVRQLCATKDKLDYLSEILESLSSPLVIFYNYTCERDQILQLAKKVKRKVWRIDGQEHEIPTAETIGTDDIVLCHYLSGSEALNLQFVSYCLFYSYNWSYSVSVQARGRIRRVGQAHPQMYWYFECENTVEQEVQQAIARKSDFAENEWKRS